MRKISLSMAVLMFLSGSGFVENAYGGIMQPVPISDSEISDLIIAEDCSVSSTYGVAGGDDNKTDSGDIAAGVFVGLLAVAGILAFAADRAKKNND